MKIYLVSNPSCSKNAALSHSLTISHPLPRFLSSSPCSFSLSLSRTCPLGWLFKSVDNGQSTPKII